MSVDYRALLWQQLNKSYTDGSNQAFVMTIGKLLLSSDYALSNENQKVAEYNTFELTDPCIGCGTTYNPTGSKISLLWDQLLNSGKGPPAGPEYKPAFDAAVASLYKDWETRTPSPYYQSYIDANATYQLKRNKMQRDYQKKYGDSWKQYYDKDIKATPEYKEWEKLHNEITPMLKAIDIWIFGPLAANIFKSMKIAFDDNRKSVVRPLDGMAMEYLYVSMIPDNWYQWFDGRQPDDPAWMTVTVDENSFDATQDRQYKRLGGDASIGHSFLSLTFAGEGSQEHKVETGNSRGVKISFKVHSVLINRPWLDLSALKINNWIVPGLAPGAWSTGVLNSSNKGSFPLLTTQLIVAKDITVTAEKFSQEVIDSLTEFGVKGGAGVIFGLFSFGVGGEAQESHSFSFDPKRSSITLKGAQVIGFIGTLMPKYAV